MIILDTNVISALMQQRRERAVDEWLDSQSNASVWTTSISIFELVYGLQILPAGKRRAQLQDSFDLAVVKTLGNRVAAFDASAAHHASELMAVCKQKGRPMEIRDTMIAGVALARRATLATRNERHFSELAVRVVNPWRLEKESEKR